MAKIDNNLVYLKSENARMALNELAKHLKKSPQRLKYMLSVLERQSIIKDSYCIFDYSYFGLILFRVYFRGGYVSEKDKTYLIDVFRKDPYITSIYELSGEFDLTVEFAAPNPSKFNKELKRVLEIASSLNDYKVVLNLVSYLCPKNYLVKDEKLKNFNVERIVGGDREKEEFSLNEILLMKHLLFYPTMKISEISRKSELNVKTVNSILKNLVKRSVIKGFKYIINSNLLNISKSRIFLRLHHLNFEAENRLMKYLIETDEVVQINKTVGDWDVEIDIEAMNKERIRYIVMRLREDFREIIENFNIIEFYDYYKISYVPMYLFSKE